MAKCRWAIGSTLALMLLCSAPSSPGADAKLAPEKAPAGAKAGAGAEAVFNMQEVSIFDQKEDPQMASVPMFGSVTASCTLKPAPEVKAYPKLKSKRALYGSITLNRDPEKPGPGVKHYFVIDESGADKAADNPPKKSTEKAEESAAPAPKKAANSGYDRLYFDSNHDLDLTNDPAVSLMKNPPENAFQYLGDRENCQAFDTVAVQVGDNAAAKDQTVRVLPVLIFNAGLDSLFRGPGQVAFLPASARKGEIRLGNKAYTAVLMQMRGTIGRFDNASCPLVLMPVGVKKGTPPYWWLNTLGTIREANGDFYTISATPSGDKLTVRPYGGERGVLEVSKGKRDVKEVGLTGLLQAKGSYLPLGEFSYMATEKSTVAKYRLPVGEYLPAMLNVNYGDLVVSLRADYTRVQAGKSASMIEIRKDKPYVLDFSEKPEVKFQTPLQDKVFKPGDDIKLAAMIAIPEKGLLIGGLDDTSKKVGEMKWMAEGKEMTSPRYESLEPTVVIADSKGKKLAQGKMPFG
jgi:hypothetical protein